MLATQCHKPTQMWFIEVYTTHKTLRFSGMINYWVIFLGESHITWIRSDLQKLNECVGY